MEMYQLWTCDTPVLDGYTKETLKHPVSYYVYITIQNQGDVTKYKKHKVRISCVEGGGVMLEHAQGPMLTGSHSSLLRNKSQILHF